MSSLRALSGHRVTFTNRVAYVEMTSELHILRNGLCKAIYFCGFHFIKEPAESSTENFKSVIRSEDFLVRKALRNFSSGCMVGRI